MISTTNAAYNLTVNNTASPSYTLKVMTVVAVIFFPIVLVYQAWGYHIFRKRLSVPRVGGDGGEDAATAAGTTTPAETRRAGWSPPGGADQSPGLLCMMPPSAKIVVAVR